MVVEVDGSFHFYENEEGEFTRYAYDELHDRVARKAGFDIVRLAFPSRTERGLDSGIENELALVEERLLKKSQFAGAFTR